MICPDCDGTGKLTLWDDDEPEHFDSACPYCSSRPSRTGLLSLLLVRWYGPGYYSATHLAWSLDWRKLLCGRAAARRPVELYEDREAGGVGCRWCRGRLEQLKWEAEETGR